MSENTFKLHIGSVTQELPRFKDCPRCGKPDSCAWQGVAYEAVCPDCFRSASYQQEWSRQGVEHARERQTFQSLDNRHAAAVWQYKDQMVTTNGKGDILSQESVKNHMAKYQKGER